MTRMPTRASMIFFLSLCGSTAAAFAQASAYPERSVRIIVPYAAGGNTDAIARLIGGRLSERLGQQFVVDNRGGASGTIAAEAVATAAPDGYTLFLASLPQMAIVPAIQKVRYNPLTDFAPVTNIGFNNFILVANPKLPIKSASDLVDYVKKNPGKLTYASGGPGSHMNLTMQLFLKRAGIEITPVHMRGGSEPINSVVAGHVPVGFLNASDVLQQANAGTVSALAVSSAARIPQMPELRTMMESGFKDFVVTSWNGIAAPVGTPPPVIEKLAGEVRMAMQVPEIVERFAAIGVAPNARGPAAFAVEIKEAFDLWGDVVRSAGLQEK